MVVPKSTNNPISDPVISAEVQPVDLFNVAMKAAQDSVDKAMQNANESLAANQEAMDDL